MSRTNLTHNKSVSFFFSLNKHIKVVHIHIFTVYNMYFIPTLYRVVYTQTRHTYNNCIDYCQAMYCLKVLYQLKEQKHIKIYSYCQVVRFLPKQPFCLANNYIKIMQTIKHNTTQNIHIKCPENTNRVPVVLTLILSNYKIWSSITHSH